MTDPREQQISETINQLHNAIKQIGGKRIVIVAGFELKPHQYTVTKSQKTHNCDLCYVQTAIGEILQSSFKIETTE